MTLKRTLLAAIIILGVLFRIWASQPTWIHWDENFYINIYQNFVDRGQLTPYMWRLGQDANIIAGSGTGYGIFVLIGWLSLVGESLFGLRMLMVLCGLVTTWIYYLISKQWWGSREAGIAAMMFGLVSTSSFYTLVGRMDAVGILSYSLLLLLYIWAVKQVRKWPHFWVGVGAILVTEFHILGLLYLAALAVDYAVRYILLVKSERRLVLDVFPIYFFLGTGLLGAIYIIVHILPDPNAYFMIPSSCSVCNSSLISTEITRVHKLVKFRPIEMILIILMVYTAFKNRRRNQHYLLLFFGYSFSQSLISPPPNLQYIHHILPILSIGIGGIFENQIQYMELEKQEFVKRATLMISVLWLGLNLIYFLTDRPPYENAYPIQKTEEIQYINENITKETVVLSFEVYFYLLKEYRNFLGYGEYLDYGLHLRQETRADFFDRIDPEVIYLYHLNYEADPVLQDFVEARDFVRVTPDLWVARDLVPQE